MSTEVYTTTLNAGVGMIEETRALLDLWQPQMSVTDLNRIALESGLFPTITARRLRNLIVECFRPRYLLSEDKPAIFLKQLKDKLSRREFNQLLYIYTCRSQLILADFVRLVYWNTYSAGRESITNEDARQFVIRANQDGKTSQPWSEGTIRRVAPYLTMSCADFGLLENGPKSVRKILPFRIESRVHVFLAYDLHFCGQGDNSVLSHPDWALFGMDRADVLNEFKRLALKDWWIIQSAGDVTRIGWQHASMEELVDAFTER